MAAITLRDRDAIVTKEGLIFRVFGYDHPPDAYICDLEYAPVEVFRSNNTKAPRGHTYTTHYKLYEDESWTYLKNHYPQYLIPHATLQKRVIGVNHHDIAEVRRPQEKLEELLMRPNKDALLVATQNVLDIVKQQSGLRLEDFGVFGSMLHSFHHPRLSDIDLIVYGRRNAIRLRETLKQLYATCPSRLRNEFDADQMVRGKNWRFRNLSPQEYMQHQQRKLIYALFTDESNRRTIKAEFESVKDWNEISNGYNPRARILQKGWVKMVARVTDDRDAFFIPSIYSIESLEIVDGSKEAAETGRIISYMEEFRLQVSKDERIYVEGNLEEVVAPEGSTYQVALTYCPRYYEQVLKSLD